MRHPNKRWAYVHQSGRHEPPLVNDDFYARRYCFGIRIGSVVSNIMTPEVGLKLMRQIFSAIVTIQYLNRGTIVRDYVFMKTLEERNNITFRTHQAHPRHACTIINERNKPTITIHSRDTRRSLNISVYRHKRDRTSIH